MFRPRPRKPIFHVMDGEPSLARPVSQLCTEGQLREPAHAYWCEQIHEVPRMHRKQWEFCYILQALAVHGCLAPSRRGLGFGVGAEPLAAVMAQRGAEVLATDLDPDAPEAQAWADTRQHAAKLADLNGRGICGPEQFQGAVEFRVQDMNAISDDLRGFDFVWSSCALEHLGSIRQGCDFILNALKTLGPKGVAVHTTEYNLDNAGDTLDGAGTVLFRRRDLEPVIQGAVDLGWRCAVNWSVGEGALDQHIDVAPYSPDQHLKLELAGYPVTSIGLLFVPSVMA